MLGRKPRLGSDGAASFMVSHDRERSRPCVSDVPEAQQRFTGQEGLPVNIQGRRRHPCTFCLRAWFSKTQGAGRQSSCGSPGPPARGVTLPT